MKKALRIVLNTIAWIIVVIAALLTLLVFSSRSDTGVPNLFGKSLVTIQTGSMEPILKVGDLIIDGEADADTLKVGDIITFKTTIDGQNALNTHKIIEVKDNDGLHTFVTKGEANNIEDSQTVHPNNIVGVYTGVRLPGFGKALDFLKTSTGFMVCIVLPLVLFFLYEVYRFIAAIIAVKKPKLTAEQEEELKQQAIAEYLAAQNASAPEAEAPETAPADEETAVPR